MYDIWQIGSAEQVLGENMLLLTEHVAVIMFGFCHLRSVCFRFRPPSDLNLSASVFQMVVSPNVPDHSDGESLQDQNSSVLGHCRWVTSVCLCVEIKCMHVLFLVSRKHVNSFLYP